MTENIILATAGDLVRRFSHYCDATLARETIVVIKKNGRARNVLLSIEEYERLKHPAQQAFLARDTPAHFIADLEELAGTVER